MPKSGGILNTFLLFFLEIVSSSDKSDVCNDF
jgi:hypothetical protein